MSKKRIETLMREIIGSAAMKEATQEELKTLCDAYLLMIKYCPEDEDKELDVI